MTGKAAGATQSDLGGDEVARLRRLAGVAGIDPGVGEKVLHLDLEHFLVDISVTVHLARANQRADGVRVVAVAMAGRLHDGRLLRCAGVEFQEADTPDMRNTTRSDACEGGLSVLPVAPMARDRLRFAGMRRGMHPALAASLERPARSGFASLEASQGRGVRATRLSTDRPRRPPNFVLAFGEPAGSTDRSSMIKTRRSCLWHALLMNIVDSFWMGALVPSSDSIVCGR